MGGLKTANNWKSQIFNKFNDMILINGEDRTDDILYTARDEGDFHRYIVYFTIGDSYEYERGYYKLDEITILQYLISEKIEDKRIYIGNTQIKPELFAVYR